MDREHSQATEMDNPNTPDTVVQTVVDTNSIGALARVRRHRLLQICGVSALGLVASVLVAVVEVHLPGPVVLALLVLLSGCAPWDSLKNSLNSASCSLLELISRLITCRSVNPKLEATVS